VAERLKTLADRHEWLPDHHFGGRPGRATMDALHLFVKTIKDAWARGQVASALFLDIKGAFPHALPSRLADNMRRLGVPTAYVRWMLSKLDGRTTCLAFDDFELEQLPIRNGIDQGCPLSVIFYLFYNSGLVKVPREKSRELCVAYIDDVTYLVWGSDFHETHAALQDMMNRPGGALEWSALHFSEFELDKTVCVDFSRSKDKQRPPLMIGGHSITPTRAHTLLGICIDQELRWKDQTLKAVSKGTAWVSQLTRLAKMSYGASPSVVRWLYLSIAVPHFTYAADIWFSPVTLKGTSARGSGSVEAATKLECVQNMAARVILDAMRSTPIAALNAFSSLPPILLRMNDICHSAAICLASAPQDHPLYKAVIKCARGRKQHIPPLQCILKFAGSHPNRLEKWQVNAGTKGTPNLLTFPRRAEAKEEAEHDDTLNKVYTDGSVAQGKAGAAALLYKGMVCRLRAGWSGSHGDPSTPLEAEVTALLIGLHLVYQHSPTEDVVIYSDSQLAIWCLHGQRTKAPTSLTKAARRMFRKLSRELQGIRISIRWCPAHARILGNEEADREAKAAAEGRAYPRHLVPVFLRDYHPLVNPDKERQAFRERCEDLAGKLWKESGAYQKLVGRFRDLNATAALELMQGLNRSRATLWFRLVTGHVQLNAHLWHVGAAPSDICGECGWEAETVVHFILRCPKFADVRHKYLCS
jgi:ribonuclease HI